MVEESNGQLDRLQDMDICGLQVNYAHSDKGGNSYGLTYESDPPLFSEEWWKLFNWFMGEAEKRGMSVSLSDYTLGTPGQGFYIDEVLNKYPEDCGSTLFSNQKILTVGQNFQYTISDTILSVSAYKIEKSDIVFESHIDLLQYSEKDVINFEIPKGEWKIIIVGYNKKADSVDPMNPLTGNGVIEFFFQRFEDQNPDEAGKGLNFFFSDELNFNIRGNLWNDIFKDEFKIRKGYDILPLLSALFEDIGPITQKVRLDYYDVIVQLEEIAYFKPVYDWHEERKMTYGCDHGGRGKDVTEFGDYFRTMKWNQGPGNDQPGLQSDIIKSKVSSSISHMYKRPRTWLEGFYGSGWGTSSGQVADATFRNFALGHNLLTLHGLYYSTHGGFWEWAPPCNHFRMPYFKHMNKFLKCSKRLSYLLSQGVHVADVAIVYPVAAVEGGIEGDKSVQTAFNIGEYLYKNGIDFDFMDYESIQKAEVSKGQLMVSGESFKVLIIPSMQTIRFSIMEKALEFSKNGGIVVCVGDLPKASERAGREDNVLDAIIKEIFYNNGTGYIVSSIEQIKSIIDKSFVRDIILSEDSESFPYFLHRKTADLDIYLVYGAPKNSQCFFRAKGNVQLWNPWNANINKLIDIQETENGTRVKMPLGKDEVQLIVFNKHESNESKFKQLDVISEIPINDEWEFSLKPTLDNTWGDFRLPANNGFIGAEMRQPEYRCENKEWSKITLGYGPKFMKLGPLSDEEDLNYIEKCLVNSNIDGLNKYDIKPYEYGERFGVEGDPGHQGYHGLKGKITDEFIVLGKPAENQTEITYGAYEEGTIYYMWTTVFSDSNEKASILTGTIKPQKVWINGAECTGETSQLKIGSNAVVLKYNIAGRTYFDLGDVVSSAEVYVNGRFVDEKCAPSWQFNITDFVHEGENNLEVYAYNTLSNHYTTIPTKYRGSLKSGLIGPVTLQICK